MTVKLWWFAVRLELLQLASNCLTVAAVTEFLP